MRILFKSFLVLVAVFIASHASAKVVYITVDDGPLGGEFNIMRALESESTPATFFWVGDHVEASEAKRKALGIIKRNKWIQLANHSKSHAHDHYRHFYSDKIGVREDMEAANKILGLTEKPYYARLPGRDVFRLPGISRNDPFLTPSEDAREKQDFDDLYAHGFYLWGWDHEWSHESSGRPIQSIPKLVEEIGLKLKEGKTLKSGHLILLMHDEMFRDVFDGENNFRNMIKALKDAGYELRFIRDYPI